MWCIWKRISKFFEKKIRSGGRATSKTGANVNEVLTQELHKPLIKEFKREKCIGGLEVIFGQRI